MARSSQRPYFDAAEMNFIAVILQQDRAALQLTELCDVLELAGGHAAAKVFRAAREFQDHHTIEPMLDGAIGPRNDASVLPLVDLRRDTEVAHERPPRLDIVQRCQG